jgi:hypothetical protein
MVDATTAPRFTIIIPTRERAATLEFALKTVTDQEFPSLEIIVSDNASTDNTRAIVEANGDPRIRYLNTGKRLSMSHNWEFALGHARGEWVGFIGDDDGLLPGCIAAIDAIARTHPIELIRSRPGNYLWPALAGGPGGHLAVPLGGTSGLRDCRKALTAALAGDISYLDLPSLYTGGFVRRSAIDRNRDGEGRFFLSRIPDVYSSVVLSGECRQFWFEARPWAINGASLASTGTACFTRSADPEHHKAAAVFATEDNIPLHCSVPENADGSLPRSLQALVFESYQQARAVQPGFAALDPAAQIAAFARTAGDHADEIAAWLPLFAAANGVATVPVVSVVRARDRAAGLLRRAVMDRLIFYPDNQPPIMTIAEASRVGAQALAERPNVAMMVVLNLLRGMARKLR